MDEIKLKLLQMLYEQYKVLDACIVVVAQLDLDINKQILKEMMDQSEKNQGHVSLWIKEL